MISLVVGQARWNEHISHHGYNGQGQCTHTCNFPHGLQLPLTSSGSAPETGSPGTRHVKVTTASAVNAKSRSETGPMAETTEEADCAVDRMEDSNLL